MTDEIQYRIATPRDLETVWEKDISRNSGDERWRRWRDEYISYNKTGKAKTFVAVKNSGEVIAQITLILSKDVKAVKGYDTLCNGKDIANFNAFRCDEEYRGKGHISRLVKLAEEFAKKNGIKKITIGAEAICPKNLMIYFHFGFIHFEMQAMEDDNLILYYSKNLR